MKSSKKIAVNQANGAIAFWSCGCEVFGLVFWWCFDQRHTGRRFPAGPFFPMLLFSEMPAVVGTRASPIILFHLTKDLFENIEILLSNFD